jgi:membrane-associated phospholipid phosphatase
MFSKPETCKLVFFISILLLIGLIQYMTSDYLENISIPLIKFLQKDSYLVKSMELVSYIGSKNVKFILMITIFSTCNIYHTFVYTFVCYFSMFICAWLKLIWQQERPYWISDEIIPFECEPGFGYPSNHVLTTVVSFMILFEILFQHFNIESYVNSKIFYWVGISVTFLLCASIGLGRIVQGVHSLDQVIFGLLMGLAIYYFFLHLTVLKINDMNFFLNLISNRYQSAKLLTLMIFIYLIFLVHIYFTPIEYNPEYVGRVLLKCPTSTPFAKSVFASGQYFMIPSMILGILYDVKYNYLKKFKTQELPHEYLEENFYNYEIKGTKEKEHPHHIKNEDVNYHFYLKVIARIIILYFMTKVLKFVCSCGIYMFEINLITKFLFWQVLYNLSIGLFIFGFGRRFCELFRLNPSEKISIH